MLKKKRKGYTHSLVCYGAPLDIAVDFHIDKAVVKEGKRKRYCRNCLKSALRVFEEALLDEFKKMGLS